MKPRFVPIYLVVTGIVLAATALAKFPAIFHQRDWCLDPNILGSFQPTHMTNEQLLGTAAGVELLIVGLICLSPWRWLPCLASALWGFSCVVARIFLMDPYVNCRCLGWLAKPGPSTNLTAEILAILITAGGWLAFRTAWQDAKGQRRDVNNHIPAKNS